MTYLNKFIAILVAKSPLFQFVLLFVLGLSITIITGPIVILFGSKLVINSDPSEFSAFIGIGLVGPFIETFLNQYLVFKVAGSNSFLARRSGLIILISALSFGVLHFYSWAYIIWAFFFGIHLAFCYYFFSITKQNAFLKTFCLHSLRNCFAILMTFLL